MNQESNEVGDHGKEECEENVWTGLGGCGRKDRMEDGRDVWECESMCRRCTMGLGSVKRLSGQILMACKEWMVPCETSG